MIEIDIASENDVIELVELLKILFREEKEFAPNSKLHQKGLKMILKNPDIGVIFVAKHKNKIIGMLNLLYSVSTALGQKVGIFEDMIIHPDYQNRGHGNKLLQFAIQYAEKKDLKRLTLLTDRDNHVAIKFYQKNGFYQSPMIPFRFML